MSRFLVHRCSCSIAHSGSSLEENRKKAPNSEWRSCFFPFPIADGTLAPSVVERERREEKKLEATAVFWWLAVEAAFTRVRREATGGFGAQGFFFLSFHGGQRKRRK